MCNRVKEAHLRRLNAIRSTLLAVLFVAGVSIAGFGYPAISNDYVFLIDKSELLSDQLDWMLDAHADVIENQIAPLADGPGQINVSIVVFRQHTQTVLGLTDVYTDLDLILDAVSPRYIDRNTDSGVNTSEAIDVGREILGGGNGFRQVMVLSSRFFPNTWNNNSRPVPCAPGADGICARVAMRQACDAALRDGYELWTLEIDHWQAGEHPGMSDFPLIMRECAGDPARSAEASSASEFSSFIDDMLDQGLNACVNVGFERDLDRNINDRVDNEEFFEAMDFWVNDCMPDSVFFNILDLWVSGDRISLIRSSSLNNSAEMTTTLTASALNISATSASAVELNVFDTSGVEIFSKRSSHSQLNWNLRTEMGRNVANGVYFAQITLYDSRGDVIGSQLKKLAVLR